MNLRCGISAGIVFLWLSVVDAQISSIWDNAPDLSGETSPPYPSLTYPNGTNLTIESIRGTLLYGFKGCSTDEAGWIKTTYDDFYTLANQPGVYNNILWDSPAATDFWGPASGTNVVPDNTRAEIQQIFAAAQQVYSFSWSWVPPWFGPRKLWIEIRCSDSKLGDDSTDPLNKCGDGKPNDGNCPGGSPPVGGGTNEVEAFSEPNLKNSRYSRITFCNAFFNLPSFKEAIAAGNALPAKQKTNLENWNNRARCFFHEITHLDYFMNAGDYGGNESPYVSDLEVKYKILNVPGWHECYGPYNAKILRNWVDSDPQYSGYFTQRNADNYAYFALAKYVQSQIGQYPSSPSPGRKKPLQAPLDSVTHGPPMIAQNVTEQGQDVDLIPGDEQDPDPIIYPGCPDKSGSDDPAVVYVDQGNLNCRGIHDDGDPLFYFNLAGGVAAIENFCSAAVSNGVVLGGAGGQALYDTAENDGYNQTLDISAEWVQGPNCPSPMDFTQTGAGDTCQERLTDVVDNCDNFVRNSSNWKQGGTFFRDCIVSHPPVLAILRGYHNAQIQKLTELKTWKCEVAASGVYDDGVLQNKAKL